MPSDFMPLSELRCGDVVILAGRQGIKIGEGRVMISEECAEVELPRSVRVEVLREGAQNNTRGACGPQGK